MEAAEPHHYVVVDADGTPDEVAERIHAGLAGMLPTRPQPTPQEEPSQERTAP
jgi:dTMP kinase